MVCSNNNKAFIGHILIVHELIFVWSKVTCVVDYDDRRPYEEIYLDIGEELTVAYCSRQHDCRDYSISP